MFPDVLHYTWLRVLIASGLARSVPLGSSACCEILQPLDQAWSATDGMTSNAPQDVADLPDERDEESSFAESKARRAQQAVPVVDDTAASKLRRYER